MKNLFKQRLLPVLSLLLITLLLLLIGGQLLANPSFASINSPDIETIEIHQIEIEVTCPIKTFAIASIKMISENIQ